MKNSIVMDKLFFNLQLCVMSPTSQIKVPVSRPPFCPITEAGEQDIRQFLHHLRHDRELCVNYYHTCLKFLFETTLDKPWNSRKIPLLRGYKTVPVEQLKQKAMLSTISGSGLRISEACRLNNRHWK